MKLVPFQSGISAVIILGLLAIGLPFSARADTESSPGDLALGKNADGRLELFHIDKNGELQHRWQRKSGDSWSAWSSLGGSFQPGVCVVSQAGRLDAFVVTRAGKEIWQITQAAPNSQNWSAWMPLSGESVQSPVAVASDQNGQLQVFATADDGHAVKHIWQTDAEKGWSSWQDLGGTISPGFVATLNSQGRLELFGADARTHELVHCSQTDGENSWTPWAALGGNILPSLAAASNKDGCLEIFAVGAEDNAISCIFQTDTNHAAKWSPWLKLDGAVTPDISVAQSADGRLEIFAVNQKDGEMVHRAEKKSNAADRWNSWADLKKITHGPFVAERDRNGNLDLLAMDDSRESNLTHTRQIKGNLRWQDWSSLEKTPQPFTVHTWQSDEGLPNDRIQAITQTRDGYLWVGTVRGVARFDGVHFTLLELGSTPGTKAPFVTSLCPDRDGSLWIGSDGGGLARLRNGVVSHFKKADGLVGDRVMAICESRDGSIWIGATTGISHYQNGKFTNYSDKDGLLSNIIRDIHEDHDGNIWITTGLGLNRISNNRIESFTQANGLPKNSLRGIFEDKKGRLWIGSNDGMILYYHDEFYSYNARFGLSDNYVGAICEDEQGNLFAGTFSGLNEFWEGKFINEFNDEGLPFGRVNALFKDREGTLWVGTREGLSRLTPKRSGTLDRADKLARDNIMSIMEDRKGNMWIGTWGGGVNEVRDEEVTAYSTTNGLLNNLCLALCEGRDGSIWMGEDFDGGIARLKNGRITHYTWRDGLFSSAVRVIHEDRSGTIWVGTSMGLSRMQNGKFKNYTVRENLAGNVVRAICEDHEGNLWIGTDGGLSCLQNGRFSNFTTREGLSDNLVMAIYEDKEQNLWIGTGAGGLDRFREGRFTAYTTREGLFSDEIFEIVEDDHGWLWMSCSKGVYRIRKQDLNDLDQGKKTSLTSIAYGKADGMESILCNGVAKPAAWKTRRGQIWFSTSKGLISFNPNEITINETPPPVYIEQLVADKNKSPEENPLVWNVAEADATNAAGLLPAESPIKIPPGRSELEFHYTALDLQKPEKILFQYKLEGFDSKWIKASTRRAVYYHNLPPGSYFFHVIACNSDGIWNQAGTSLAVVLLPNYWQTWWFQALIALVIAVAAIATMRYLTRKKLHLELARLEQRHSIERERSRIARDMHDDLGARLSEIVLNGNLATKEDVSQEKIRHLAGRMTHTARELVDSLDAIVWAVNPKNDSLDKFVDYVCEYLQSYLETASIQYSLDIPDQVPAWPLSSEVRHHLYLVIKEALHNIVIHARATQVRFRLQVLNSALAASIEDNGKGFSREASSAFGNGLQSMESRIKNVGGRFEVISQPGRGTRIYFQIPLRQKSDPI